MGRERGVWLDRKFLSFEVGFVFELDMLCWYEFVDGELRFFCVGKALGFFDMLVVRDLVCRVVLVLGETPKEFLFILIMNKGDRVI
jgi:hypothetical protein